MQLEANYDSGQQFVYSCVLRASRYTCKERDTESSLELMIEGSDLTHPDPLKLRV